MEERCTKLQESVAQALTDSTMPLYAVTDRVVLAGQPQPDDWARLRAAGFGTVINIRSDRERAQTQATSAETAGLSYVHLPLPAYELESPHLATFQEQLATALATDGKVLIHCRTASRTALLWLLARVSFDGWTQPSAETELAAAGYTADDMEVFRFCASDYFERLPASAEMP